MVSPSKSMVRHRALKARHSDPGDPRSHMKNLAGDFDSVEDAPVAEEAARMDAEEELVPAAPHPVFTSNTADSAAQDFWRNMKMMLDDQRVGITRDPRGEMQAQEERLGARIDAEKNERVKEKEATDKKLTEITERLQALETRPATAATPASSWTPRFVILVG